VGAAEGNICMTQLTFTVGASVARLGKTVSTTDPSDPKESKMQRDETRRVTVTIYVAKRGGCSQP
jgi:hypothetical protein